MTTEHPTLLSRDDFRSQVFNRDDGHCVICGEPGADAHHIIERRLFPDGGYYLDNGATLCAACHIRAEMTVLSCAEIREAAGITQIVLPPHLYSDAVYDKWGNILLPNGTRLRGELFYDGSVQKILGEGGVLGLFTERVRYPRTYHLPWSPGLSNDDRTLPDTSHFAGRRVVVTVKMDGEQTTMYSDYLHSRSLEWTGHPSRSWVANLHGQMGWKIPPGWRVCGENLYAKHSIHYRHLPSYFSVFSVWNEHNVCLAWDETVEWAALLDLPVVPILYDGLWDEERIGRLYTPTYGGDEMEGYVVRLADSFSCGAFRHSVAKYVRADHTRTRPHWFHGQSVIPNQLQQTKGEPL